MSHSLGWSNKSSFDLRDTSLYLHGFRLCFSHVAALHTTFLDVPFRIRMILYELRSLTLHHQPKSNHKSRTMFHLSQLRESLVLSPNLHQNLISMFVFYTADSGCVIFEPLGRLVSRVDCNGSVARLDLWPQLSSDIEVGGLPPWTRLALLESVSRTFSALCSDSNTSTCVYSALSYYV